jgi:hypothetical protein
MPYDLIFIARLSLDLINSAKAAKRNIRSFKDKVTHAKFDVKTTSPAEITAAKQRPAYFAAAGATVRSLREKYLP